MSKVEYVRTLLGDLQPSELGYCQCHEHLLMARGRSCELTPSLLMDDPEKTTRELIDYRQEGGRAVVDAQPVGCGRMARELAEASRESGIHIIASTGFHKLDFYLPGHFVYRYSEEELERLFTGELSEGIYANYINDESKDKSRLAARAGIIKAASDGRDFVNGREDNLPVYRKLFAAAAAASRATGAPILTHLEMGCGADAQLEALLGAGVPAESVILSHIDRVIEPGLDEYYRRIVSAGVFLQLDTIARPKYHDDIAEARLILRLCELGFGNRILLGLDTTRERLKSYGGATGLCYILEDFRLTLEENGLGKEMFDRFTVENPKLALRFRQTTMTKESGHNATA